MHLIQHVINSLKPINDQAVHNPCTSPPTSFQHPTTFAPSPKAKWVFKREAFHCKPMLRLLGRCAKTTAVFDNRRKRLATFTRAGTKIMAQQSVERQKVLVHCPPDLDSMTITIKIGGRERKLNRSKTELLERALGRIRVSLQPKADKRLKRKGLSAAPQAKDIFVALYDSAEPNGDPLDESILNEVGWSTAKVLVVDDMHFDIVLNPPTVEKVLLAAKPMVGVPLLPVPTFRFAEEDACGWGWSRRKPNSEWEALEWTDQLYIPNQDDLGCRIRVDCTPGVFDTQSDQENGASNKRRRLGEALSVETGPVVGMPLKSSGDGRHELTQEVTESPKLRVVTYNVLADQYAAGEYAEKVLFDYCDKKFLSYEYRKQLILSELIGYNGDIICVQEVDQKLFERILNPYFGTTGFAGMYCKKSGSTKEGSALFVRQSRYSIVYRKSVSLREAFKDPLEGDLACIRPMVDSWEHLRVALQKVATVAQIAVLVPNKANPADRPLLVTNTHLFYHSHGSTIRTLHTYALAWTAKRVAESNEVVNLLGGVQPTFLFCGDLNSGVKAGVPGVIELLMKGQLPADFGDWNWGANFKWGKDDEEDQMENGESEGSDSGTDSTGKVIGVDLAIPMKFDTALDLSTPWTNYTKLYTGLLDYIFFEPDQMQVDNVIPLPTAEQIGSFIPSQVYPSDHLAVVVDLAFKPQDSNPPPSNKTTTTQPVPATESNVHLASTSLQNSGVIAIHTDTLYGFAADAENGAAVQKIYEIKGRSSNVPLAICVGDVSDVGRYCSVDHLQEGLLGELLPGPVTLVLKRKDDGPLTDKLNPGLATLGVRIPASEFIRKVCRAHGGALALTSANLSGQPSSLSVTDFKELWEKCSAVFDGGVLTGSRQGSTVVDLTEAGRVRVVREGSSLTNTLGILRKFGWRDDYMDDGTEMEESVAVGG